MNYSMIRYIIGWLLIVCGAIMVLPLIVAIIYHENTGWYFLISIGVAMMAGYFLQLKKPKNTVIYTKESLITVALCWVFISFFGGVPFLISGVMTNPFDASFETVSGFTTTGASILTEVEHLPKCILFWRSFTHWIGGMGILVFILAILPMTGGYQINLMKAESPGPKVGKLVPKVQSTAKMLYKLYLAMTIIQILFLLAGRMPVFDALTVTFGTAGTGGFAIKNDSMASYSTYIQVIVTIFMALFGINFNVYFLLFMRKFKEALHCEELKNYLMIMIGTIIIITLNVVGEYKNPLIAIRDVAFSVSSVMTTTGYGTVDFDKWPELSRTLLVLIMFVGACAGSTGGGIKVSRIGIMVKSIRKEINHFVYPNNVEKIRYEHKVVEHEVLRSINVFFIAYVLVFIISLIIVSLDNFDLITNFTAVASAINNIGPGLNEVGPTKNFSSFSDLSKFVLSFDMLAGRLEIFPMLMLLLPKAWKKF